MVSESNLNMSDVLSTMNIKDLQSLAKHFGWDKESEFAKLPNYCGIDGIKFIWHGEWSDPEIEYKGKRCNVHDIEDSMWAMYRETYPEPDYKDRQVYTAYEDYFSTYMQENADMVRELCEEVLFGSEV